MKKYLLAFFPLFFSMNVLAQVTVVDPWVRGTVPAQMATGAFMKLKSATDLTLVGVESSIAGVSEIHEMRMEGDLMKMQAIQRLFLPAGETVELKPGSHHIMLINLREQVKEGKNVPITLIFENSAGAQERIEIEAPVVPLGTEKGTSSPIMH